MHALEAERRAGATFCRTFIMHHRGLVKYEIKSFIPGSAAVYSACHLPTYLMRRYARKYLATSCDRRGLPIMISRGKKFLA